ncbi:MAG TPA: RNA 3'-terminal phosphate cyclase, partial [Kofleriaceae bacterium]|nr:RNA 3'-terminal phosphate cyclase [Kofleriaceae bacterium]
GAGAALGSRELTFAPGPVAPGAYRFAVGTAGSACLVLQTVAPALVTAGGPSHLVLEGGTHNPKAPPFDFLARVFLPLLARMGPRVSAAIERHGFYPAGGGRVVVDIAPAPALAPIELLAPLEVEARRARALLARLPRHIGERELRVVQDRLGWSEAECAIEEVDSPGPGNALHLEVVGAGSSELASGFGERGVPAETVALGAADEVRALLAAGVPVGCHLADQLLLPLALAGGGAFLTLPLSLHARTAIDVIAAFGAARFEVQPAAGGNAVVVAAPAG